MNDPESQPPWWGTFPLEPNTGGEWQVGPSTLWVYRSTHDWRAVHRPSTDPDTADPMAQRSAVTCPVPADEMAAVLEREDDALATNRYSVRRTDETLALRPAMADRPVVARPEHPLSVLPDEAVTLYISTPLWMRIELVESARTLGEVPSHRMSDTWFGPNTQTGMLCYATRTAGRLRLDNVPPRLHRAVTPLKVHNQATEPLKLERVQLPAPHLALYATPDDVLWTDAVRMTHRTEREGAQVQVRPGSPADITRAEQVQAPREKERNALLTSTFSAVGALFGP